ncbi:DUF2797 domain-containing protein [Apibacter muscae]|uniref:DUF2797 domain-containing protein n=1 Tax=Apibacter muscae TaxID=2509004 RepID=A0A563D985_9FLAO|nr:DUF2797 domain-containing protein [Apibacter muscae]TWP26858.1 DUF2797 domain-containing protein [Apibacter muscae]
MIITGLLTKMVTELDNPIHYYLNFEEEIISVNQLLNKNIKVKFNHCQCLECENYVEIFAMGFCKKCYFSSPHTGEWVVRPELSKAHLGEEDRNLNYESKAQLQPHVVYLANTGGIKVGVTRKSQIPTRWIDQGAEYAIPLAETENRYEAGLIEVALKEKISDKTNYRKMLQSEASFFDLEKKKNELKDNIPNFLQKYYLEESELIHLKYPIVQYPLKITSVNLKKVPEFEGKLIGIKGQYWLFENHLAFNIRSHEGFAIDIEF